MDLNQFTRIDMEGCPLTFKSFNKATTKSLPGALFSLVFYLFAVYYVVSEFVWYYQNPSVKEYQVETVNQPAINFRDYADFMLMMCKVDSFNNSISNLPVVDNVIEETLILNLVSRVPFYYRSYAPVKLEKCKYEMFPSDLINERNYKNYYEDCTCASPESLRDFNVSFFFSDSYYTYLEWTTQFKSEIMNDTKKLQAAFDVLAREPPRSEFFFVDTSAQINNIRDPFKIFFNSHLNYINPESTGFSDIWFNKIVLDIDDNYFINDNIQSTGISRDTSVNYYQYKPLDKRKDGFLQKIRIRTSNKIITIKRRNTKLDIFLGQKLSFLAAFYIVFVIIIRTNNTFEADKKIVRNLFRNYKVSDSLKEMKKQIEKNKNEVVFGDEKNEDNDLIDLDLDFEQPKEYNPIYGYVNNRTANIKKGASGENVAATRLNKGAKFNSGVVNSRNDFEWVSDRNKELKPINQSNSQNKPRNQPPSKFVSSEEIKAISVNSDRLVEVAKVSGEDVNENKNDKAPTVSRQDTLKKIHTANTLIENEKEEDSNKEERYTFNFNYLTLCCKHVEKKDEEDFLNTRQFVNYYLDVQVYLKKMLEFELFKFIFLSKNEREVLSLLCNPDSSIEDAFKVNYNLKNLYETNISENLKEVNKDKEEKAMMKLVQDGKERKVSKRLLKLIDDKNIKFKL